MKLIIANRNYSSWSLRAWLALRHFEVEFTSELFQLDNPDWLSQVGPYSPTGKVPALVDGDLVVPESIAIIEYIADLFPERRIWPADIRERARARAAAAEMHAGFSGLRSNAPMNLRASYPGRVPLDMVAKDLSRLEVLWGDLLKRSGGPYLFGAFSGADAMYAPVATRIRTYGLPVSDTAMGYVEAIYALPAFQEWLADALKEPWVVDHDEIDNIHGKRD